MTRDAPGRAAADLKLMVAVRELEELVPARFRALIYRHYDREGRSFPWRLTRDPYRILVSEFMLQQTQVERVLTKYETFLRSFPDFSTLASASLAEVLTLWQGLGYNRRAKALRETARLVVEEEGGALPEDPERLERFPGVGGATAGAVAAFAFGRPAVFLETNIRRVFIHFFFPPSETVRDREILPLAASTLDRRDPRRWYYALMDYGVMLKKSVANPNRRSAHYQRQSPFEGSDRQVRSGVLKTLLAEPGLRPGEVMDRVGVERERGRRIIGELRREGFLEAGGGRLRIA
jgi:A/G-specific adenine glycosylase